MRLKETRVPEVTSPNPGTSSWADLPTNDKAGALTIYSGRFAGLTDPQGLLFGAFKGI